MNWIIVIGAVIGVLLTTTLSEAQQSQSTLSERSYFDRNGSFAGSSKTLNNNTTSAYDRDGHYAGQSIRNSDGTTSLYDRSGHFTGSSTNTTQPGGFGGRR